MTHGYLALQAGRHHLDFVAREAGRDRQAHQVLHRYLQTVNAKKQTKQNKNKNNNLEGGTHCRISYV